MVAALRLPRRYRERKRGERRGRKEKRNRKTEVPPQKSNINIPPRRLRSLNSNDFFQTRPNQPCDIRSSSAPQRCSPSRSSRLPAPKASSNETTTPPSVKESQAAPKGNGCAVQTSAAHSQHLTAKGKPPATPPTARHSAAPQHPAVSPPAAARTSMS